MLQLQNMLRFKMGWVEPSGPNPAVAVSARIRLARNLGNLPFVSRASAKAHGQVLDQVFVACRRSKLFSKAAQILIDDIEPIERLFLVERRLASRDLVETPKNRGLIVGDRELMSLMINEEDHVRLQGIHAGLALRSLWETVRTAAAELGNTLSFAAHPKWGWLTACPTNAGTGMRVSVLLHLPALALTGQIQRVLQSLAAAGMTARGLYGEGTRVLGDFYQISNAASMGRTEEDILMTVERVVKGLVTRELESQAALARGHQRMRLEDRVWRSLGLLSQARAITHEEAMHHLSMARLAASLGWKIPVSLETLNELAVMIQPGHVQMLAEKNLEPAQRDYLRATLLRRKFKP